MRFAASSACARKVLRPSSPPLRGRASPQGEAAKRLTIFAEENFVSKILCENKVLCALQFHLRATVKCCAPHHRRYAAELPPKGKPRSG